MKSFNASLVLLLGSILAGCAVYSHAPVDWQRGAKRGWVVEFYDANTPPERIPACLAAMSPADLAQHHYVRLRYHHVRVMHTEVAELPPGVSVQMGEMVELWPADCAQGALSHITRVLPAAP
ncbi:hypothetical protein [Duganella sp. Dugasp56]|uniref:hypothetical protein n=1 Tax=Duganella sp. Dugasp56 TaxID=3243046 RepID=UPI0039B03C4C